MAVLHALKIRLIFTRGLSPKTVLRGPSIIICNKIMQKMYWTFSLRSGIVYIVPDRHIFHYILCFIYGGFSHD